MASINGVGSSSSVSSLYNSSNIISGLASGMDTEGMIENLVKTYQNKIQTLNNKATKIQWKQDSYRNIISKMAAFSSKYTSYTSSTNLLSAGFFNSSVKVAPQGRFGDKVTASGRTDSDVVLTEVGQLATAARYVTRGGVKGDTGNVVAAEEAMRFDDDVTLGTLSGSLSFAYGSKSVSITFDEVADRIGVDEDGNKVELTAQQKAQKVADLIKEKLGGEKITLSTGESVSAADRIGVKVGADGTISFADKSGAGNSVYISSASDSVKSVLGIGDTSSKDDPVKSFRVSGGTALTKDVKAYEYLSGKGFNINVDGETKSIYMPKIEALKEDESDAEKITGYKLTMPSTVKDKYGNTSYVYDTSKLDKDKYTITKQGESKTVTSADDIAGVYTDMLQKGVKSAFGSKLEVSNTAEDGGLKLEFKVKDGSNLLINSSVGETLGIGRTATNYLNTSSSLKDLLPEDGLKGLELKDEKGELVKDANGKQLYEFKLNDVVIGRYTEDSTLSDIMSDINSNSEAGVKVSYSKTTREFVFNSKETGSENQIDIDGGLAEALFGSTKLSEESKGTFGEAYGVSLREGDRVSFKLDGVSSEYSISVGKDEKIEDVAKKLNASLSGRGYTAAYNKYTGGLEITDDKSGAKVDMEMWIEDKFLGRMDLELDKDHAPSVTYIPGQDARFTVKVNGTEKTLTRGSNDVEIDGLTINFKEAFRKSDEDYEEISFKTSTDSDKIVDAVKSMVTDYNEMMSEIRKAYGTMPYQDSSGAFKSYEPLTEEQKTGMSESEIKNYEERAKQGILFGDSTLRSLYERMQQVFQPGGADSALLQKIGISTSFSSDNTTMITLDESKLREALDNDPDQVAEIFTRTGESGVSSNGVMQGLKTQLDRYAGLTGSTKGILIQQAGTPLNSLSLLDNQWQKEIDTLGNQIEKWQDKLESQVDRYTSMFSRLEVLINQMNSQSSTLAGLMGG